MTNKNKVQSDLIKSKYEKISKILAHIEQQPFFFDYSSAESEEQNIGLICIKGYN
jgi:hypothetical protein